VTIEDQAAALFARANPVPSVDLLDPIEPVDIDSIRTRSAPRGELTEPKTFQTTASRLGWRRLAPAMAMIAILVVAVPVLINVTPLAANPTRAEQVANGFMAAINEHDGTAIRGMYALEDQELMWNPDLWPAVTELNQALGFEYTDVHCVERPPISYAGREATPVECSWTLQQDLTKALGLAATEGTYTVYVDGGEIVRTVETWPESNPMDQSFAEFRSWVQANHPDDESVMYSSPPDTRQTPYANDYAAVESDSVALWAQYVDDFVAEVTE
jgi:hypothetical protein